MPSSHATNSAPASITSPSTACTTPGTWGPARFINLGIVVGQTKESTQPRRYDPLESLAFLEADLQKNVGQSKMPVVLTHHIDLARYTGAANPTDPANLQKEWNPCDVHAYHELIQNYNIAAILYGHTHARNVFRWDGHTTKSPTGLDVFNVDNSSHFNSDTQSLFYFELTPDQLTAREYTTKDRWKTGAWTPQTWRGRKLT